MERYIIFGLDSEGNMGGLCDVIAVMDSLPCDMDAQGKQWGEPFESYTALDMTTGKILAYTDGEWWKFSNLDDWLLKKKAGW